jgi:hypothetical protein
MSEDDGGSIGYKVSKDNVRLADAIIKVLKDNAESPEAACAALMLAHAKLWILYGDSDGVASMMAEYVTDFFTITKAMETAVPPPRDKPLH